MSKLKFIGNLSYGEKYTDKQTGEEKWKNTYPGSLFFDEEKGQHVIKFLGSWINVLPPRINEKGYQKAKQAIEHAHAPDSFEDEIPF